MSVELLKDNLAKSALLFLYRLRRLMLLVMDSAQVPTSMLLIEAS